MAAYSGGSRKMLQTEFKVSDTPGFASAVEIVKNELHDDTTVICFAWQKKKERIYGRRAMNLIKR